MHNKKMDTGLEHSDVIYLQPSNLSNVDACIYEWLTDSLDIQADTHEGFKKVPILWASAERSFQIKNQKELHDSDGGLVFPLITVGRIEQKRGLFMHRSQKLKIIAAAPLILLNKLIKIRRQILPMLMHGKCHLLGKLTFLCPKIGAIR